jgi:hypothetical protein
MTMTDVYLASAVTPHPDLTGESHGNYERPASGTPFPASMPESQLFYWTRKWQADEAESAVELAEGQGQTFDNADEAIRWLLDPND